jgi:hypothetical protein
MNGFIMHVGHQNTVDIAWTMAKRRRIDEMVSQLPAGEERAYFANDKELHSAFPSGVFNCWGVPPGASGQFENTAVGDAVFFAPFIGIHGGGIHYLGIIKAICRCRCSNVSGILWPQTPNHRVFPHVFFFDTETGNIVGTLMASIAGFVPSDSPISAASKAMSRFQSHSIIAAVIGANSTQSP